MEIPSTLRGLRRPWRQFVRTITDFLLPEVCPACGGPHSGLCQACDQNLVRRRLPACPRCGEPLLEPGAGCAADHRDLRQLTHLVAPWRFAGTGGALVRRFKLDGDAGAGRFMVRAMVAAFRAQVAGRWRRAVVVPVPLHATRRAERGFDQAAWLANAIGQRLGFGGGVGVLVRVRPTLPQGDPRVTSRSGNVDGAFSLARRGMPAVTGRRVVLVDDVFTSGATARACAELLRSAGATEVAVLTACRS